MADEMATNGTYGFADDFDPAELAEAEALEALLNPAHLAPPSAPPLDPAVQSTALALRAALVGDDAAGPAFTERLRADLLDALPIATPTAMPARVPKRARPSRRALLAGGLGAVAGMAAGAGLTVLATQANHPTWDTPLVGLGGQWYPVAMVADLQPGTVVRFATEQIVGHVLQRADGSLLAISAACTHMGCLVAWNASARTFDCPCHAGRFDAEGNFFAGKFHYSPLPTLQTRIENGQISVFVPNPRTDNSAAADPAPTDPGYTP